MNEEERKIGFEQYKILVESINKLNETRESSNNFWIGVNGIGVSAIAYLRDTQNIAHYHKHFLLWTLIVIGIFLCFSWISYLTTIKNSLATRGLVLMELEKGFPVPLFSKVFALSHEKASNTPLTQREMLVPYLFLLGYIFFGVLLFFFTQEIVSSASQPF